MLIVSLPILIAPWCRSFTMVNFSFVCLSLHFGGPAPIVVPSSAGRSLIMFDRLSISYFESEFVWASTMNAVFARSQFSHFLSHPICVSSSTISLNGQAFGVSQMIYSSNVTISSCTFTACANSSGFGGALYIDSTCGSLVLLGSYFSSCYASYGGAVYVSGITSTNVSRCCFSNCTVQYNYGGSCFSSSHVYYNFSYVYLCRENNGETNYFTSPDFMLYAANFSKCLNVPTVSVALFSAQGTSTSTIRYATVSENTSPLSGVGLRGSDSNSAVNIVLSNFISNVYGSHGLFQTEGGAGHKVTDCVFRGNSGAYFVGRREDFGYSDVTFYFCAFDSAVSVSSATVSFTGCVTTSSPSPTSVDRLATNVCDIKSSPFTATSPITFAVHFAVSALSVMIDV